jgi:hypothetical protein
MKDKIIIQCQDINEKQLQMSIKGFETCSDASVLVYGGYKLAKSMKESPSRVANSHADSQEIPNLLWDQKDHYHVQKKPPWPLS